ncbi:MAG TPA: hypothetical protein VLM18_02645 [Croceibacterium sp.]|nr:hypothetical protein [Croceibacterium sp.]
MKIRFGLAPAMAALASFQPLAAAESGGAAPATVSASAPSGKDAAAGKADKNKPERKICHREMPTGSITPVRVCRTQAEIDENAERGQAQLDDLNRMRQQQTGSVRQ